MFIKGSKKAKEDKEDKLNLSNKAIAQYCRMNRIDMKMIDDALLHFPKQITEEIKAFEKTIKDK
jgi:hypothetical protein